MSARDVLASMVFALLVMSAVMALGSSSVQAQMMGPEPDTAAADTANTTQQNVADVVLGLISNRFSPLYNALSLPGAPTSNGEIIVTPAAITNAVDLSGWTVWASGANTWQRDKQTVTKSHGTLQTATLGVDRALNSMVTMGLSANYSHTRTTTTFNGGRIRSDAGSIVPYVNLIFNDWLTSDISVGYSFGRTRQRRIIGAALSTGSYNTDGIQAAVNFNASKWQGKWLLAGKLGLLVNSNHQTSFTENSGVVNAKSTDDLVQLRVGGTVSYWLASVLPYVSLMYEYDISRERPKTPGASNDREDIELGAGVNFYGSGNSKGLTAGIGVTTIASRKNKNNTTASINARYSF